MFTETFQIIEDKIKITTGAVVLPGSIHSGRNALRHKLYQRRLGHELMRIIWAEGPTYLLVIKKIKTK